MAITFPEHSFYKMVSWDGVTPPEVGDHNPNTAVDPCADDFELCLPVYDSEDIRFQFFSSDDAATSTALGLSAGIVDMDGERVPVPSDSYFWDFSEISNDSGVLDDTFVYGDTVIEMGPYTGYLSPSEDYTAVDQIILALNNALADDGKAPLSAGSSNMVYGTSTQGHGDIEITVDGVKYTIEMQAGTDRWEEAAFYDSTNEGSVGVIATMEAGLRTTVGVGNCFRITLSGGGANYISKYCFKIVDDKCFTTQLTYSSNENSLGFEYVYDDGADVASIPFGSQKVRLWMWLNHPQPKEKKDGYRRSTGEYKNTALVMEAVWEGDTEWLPWDMHEKITVALGHDTIIAVNQEDDYAINIYKDADYDIQWADKREYPRLTVAPAEFKVKESPYANFNHNCRI